MSRPAKKRVGVKADEFILGESAMVVGGKERWMMLMGWR